MSPAYCLAGYGVVVAVAAPLMLRTSVTARAPRLGVAAWLIAVGSVLLSWAAALTQLSVESATLASVMAGALFGLLGLRILWAAFESGVQMRARRERQRDGLAVLGRQDRALNVVLVDAPEPMVYCLPGRPGTVVVTTAARNALTRPQLRAVLAHERAHIAGRHSVLLAAMYVVAKALPGPRLFRSAADQVATLLEMCADDVAARAHGRHTVAAALAAMSPARVPALALGAAGPTVLARARRLCQPETPARRRLGKVAVAMSLALFAAGPYLSAISPLCAHPWW